MGEADSGEAAVKIVDTLRLDVVLLDLSLPGISAALTPRELEIFQTTEMKTIFYATEG